MKLVINSLKIKPIFLFLVIVTFFSSCANNWLDIEPENDLIQQEYWKTKSDVMSVLAATYDSNRSSVWMSFHLGEVRADFLIADDVDYYYNEDPDIVIPDINFYDIGVNDIKTTNGGASWLQYYNTINLANTVMHYAPIVQELDQTLTDEIIKGINSEMLFLRSLSYFYMVRIWKDIPLILTATTSDEVDFFIPKNTEDEIIIQIISDLKKASALANTKVREHGRADKYAIQALLADVLLWNENYSECITYCDSIINTGVFNLETKTNWFKLYYPGNSVNESIFEIQYDDKLPGQENGGFYTGVASELARMSYDKQIDVRYCSNKGPLWKYQGVDENGKIKRTSNERDANFIYYRYSEILLMKAEALAEKGNFADANFYVSQVAERAGITHLGTTELKSFRTALLTERGREFGAEGKRWFDVLRFAKKDKFDDKQFLVDIMLNKANDAQELAVMRRKVIDTMSYYLPIHKEEMQYNKNLVQNPFYDR